MSENDMEVETGFSLMDLAGANTDDIAVLLTRLPPVAVYTVKCEKLEGTQGEATEKGPGLIRFNYEYEVLGAKPVEKNVDPQTLVGRKLRESYTIWPKSIDELLGLLKGRYQKVGLPNTGILGGVPGAAPGWLDSAVGHIFELKVFHFTREGVDRAGFDWIGPVAEASADSE